MMFIIILLELLLIMRGFLVLWASKENIINEDKFSDLSVVIPLKGWDQSLPTLIESLLDQKDSKSLQVIIVIDSTNPYRNKIPKDKRILLLNSEPIPAGWRDKNWRLYQGTKHASYANVLFIDSDVFIDSEFLKYRIKNHKGDFSYSVPVYRKPGCAAEKYLAAFTNYHNFNIYKATSAIMDIGTAVGPSIYVTAGRDTLLKCIFENKGEIADDHAFGYWFKKNDYTVSCSQEPIFVMKTGASWSEVFGQIKRWIILPRTILHLLMPLSAFLLSINIILNSTASFSFYTGLILISIGNSTLGIPILIASLVYIFTETIFLIIIESCCTKRVYSNYPWIHFIFLPFIFITQPLLALQTLLSKKIEWRGSTIQINKSGVNI